MGVPLHRLRIAMRVDNPLLTAWASSDVTAARLECLFLAHSEVQSSSAYCQ